LAYTVFQFCNAIRAILATETIVPKDLFVNPYYIEASTLGNMLLVPGINFCHDNVLASVIRSTKSYGKNLMLALILFVILALAIAFVLWIPYYQTQKEEVFVFYIN
jgi:hypothetical protein